MRYPLFRSTARIIPVRPRIALFSRKMTVFLRKTAGFFGKKCLFTSESIDGIWQSWEGQSGGDLTLGSGIEGRAVFGVGLTSVRAFSTSGPDGACRGTMPPEIVGQGTTDE